MQFRDLKKQYQVLQSEIDKSLLDAVASGAFIMGKQVKELEASLAEFTGVKHCIACANGTDALTLALKTWNIGAGDAVFVPDFTFFASAEVACEVQNKPASTALMEITMATLGDRELRARASAFMFHVEELQLDAAKRLAGELGISNEAAMQDTVYGDIRAWMARVLG